MTKAKRKKIAEEMFRDRFAQHIDHDDYVEWVESILKKHLAPGIKASSAKGKGRDAQQWLRDRIRTILSFYWELHDPDHVNSIGMGQSGMDILLSPTAKKVFPFAFEVKNQDKIGFWPVVAQAKANASNLFPAIMFKKNRTEPWIAVQAEVFLGIWNLLSEEFWSKMTNIDHDMMFNLKSSIKEYNEQLSKKES